MTDALKPRDAKDVQDAVQWALSGGKTLEVIGRGSKRALGRPSQSDLTLDLSGLSGVTLYEPEELVLSAKAGTPIAEIEALVEQRGQQLEFEPMDCGPVLGVDAGAGSLGGALAANLSGPRRIKSGAARDHFLGVSAVSGRGEAFKSGGRVVKNVTGYDLCKLLAGSYGTLAAMIDVTIKTLPKPETEATVAVALARPEAAHTATVAGLAPESGIEVPVRSERHDHLVAPGHAAVRKVRAAGQGQGHPIQHPRQGVLSGRLAVSLVGWGGSLCPMRHVPSPQRRATM